MKRFVSILALALGVSVSSYATLINNAGGAATGNLAGAGAALLNFDGSGFPIGAFSSLPFSISGGSGTFTGTIQWLNTSSAVCNPGTNQNCGSVYSQGGSDRALSTYNFSGGAAGATSGYANILRMTFTSGNVSELGLNIQFNDSRASGGNSFVSGLNYMLVNFVGGGNSGQQSLPNQYNNSNANNFFGWTANSGQLISSVDFVVTGLDAGGALALDIVAFDDLRLFAAGTTSGGGTTTSGGGGVIPEPSTYALIGAGLAALAYARRRK